MKKNLTKYVLIGGSYKSQPNKTNENEGEEEVEKNHFAN